MISKELLSEVTGHNVTSVNCVKNNTLRYFVSNEFYNTLNIYELAHKCKEWAEKNNFNLVSSTSFQGDGQPCCMPVSSNGCEYQWIDGNIEYEAIFKACEWILKEQNEK